VPFLSPELELSGYWLVSKILVNAVKDVAVDWYDCADAVRVIKDKPSSQVFCETNPPLA
jgi:hypothetical protein